MSAVDAVLQGLDALRAQAYSWKPAPPPVLTVGPSFDFQGLDVAHFLELCGLEKVRIVTRQPGQAPLVEVCRLYLPRHPR